MQLENVLCENKIQTNIKIHLTIETLRDIIIKQNLLWEVFYMVEINKWTGEFIKALDKTFGSRVWFAGLQGSYGRGEATESSDIDTVVILDKLTASDIKIYDNMLDTLADRDLICGFLSGKDEILNWETSDLFQFYYDTRAIKGSLDEIFARIDENAAERAVKIAACNIYHSCVHNMLYEKSEEILRALYKSASFAVQAICFKKIGKYIVKQRDLLGCADEEEKQIVRTFLYLKNGGTVDFEEMSAALFSWSKSHI